MNINWHITSHRSILVFYFVVNEIIFQLFRNRRILETLRSKENIVFYELEMCSSV